MSFKTSYSQNSTYANCPKHWDFVYNHRVRPITESANLHFGSAIDAAVTSMLDGKTDYLDVFYDRWKKAFQFGKSTPIFDNPNIIYSYNDFDEQILKDTDNDKLLLWAAELQVGDTPNGVELVKTIGKAKKNPYKTVSTAEQRFYNRACWLSLQRKGEILLESFKAQFYPKITKVIATQKYAAIKDDSTGDVISGFIDMVLEIEGYDKPIIFDLKTASQPYTQDQIDLTEQLTLYAAMKAQEYNTDLVGYVVLSKNIPKEVEYICTKCGHTKGGKFKTCENRLPTDGSASKLVRCGGEWKAKVKVKPEVQVLVEQKTPKQINDLLDDYSNIILAMKNKIVYKNTSKCNSWYGGPCPYKNLCWKGSMDGLIRKADSTSK